MEDTARSLAADLEAAVVRALRRDYDSLNYNHFRSALLPPQLALADGDAVLGRWHADRRLIEIARALVLGHPWGSVVEVLKHEMAHQYVHEVMNRTEAAAHGVEFRKVCERLGIDASARGLPRPAGDAGRGDEDRLPRRIAKLLALAESPNRHEAEAAMRQAQRLMLTYNVDVTASRAARRYGFRHLGEPSGRLQAYQHHLAGILGDFFFVETIWVTVHRPLDGLSGSVLEVCGSAENLEMAAYVHDFLLAAAERLWRDHKRASRIASDRDRRSYLTGVMRGFHQQLAAAAKENRSAGLVWVPDADLGDYYATRHPRRRSVRTQARGSAQAFHRGQDAGRTLVLHKPVAAGATSGPRALPPRRG